MSIIRRQLPISGMTCVNCQNRIEQTLGKMAGVKSVSVSYVEGSMDITFDTEKVLVKDIAAALKELGYQIAPQSRPEEPDVSRTLSLLVIMLALYIVLQRFGILNLLVPSRLADSGMGYGMLFIVGLITSVHCIAMCGGINLSQCIPKSAGESGKSGVSAYVPALLYNLGRVISYTVIGFLLGLVGMALGGGSEAGVPVLLQGIIKLVAGVFMVIMGINMLGIFPWLRRFTIRMPKSFAVKLGKQSAAAGQPLFVGLLNGLMPCGPLQSMQIVALATGNPFAGALSMFVFSLGTVPLMLGLGSIVSALGKKYTHTVMNIGAVLVVVLGLAMLAQGGSLSGLLPPEKLLFAVIALSALGVAASIPFPQKAYRRASIAGVLLVFIVAAALWTQWSGMKAAKSDAGDAASAAQMMDGVQVVNSTLESGKYPSIIVQAGIPVRWIIDAPEGSINGCNYKMIIQAYGIEHAFEAGENIIEFTPAETGTVPYTCWMGMIHANIYVVDNLEESGEIYGSSE